MNRLKARKAPGTCGIMPEMLMSGGEVIIEWLVKLLKVVWEKGVAPTGWKTAIIVPIHNKGKAGWSVTTIGNQLIECCWECFASVLNDRVKDLMAGSVMDEQGGFRSGRGMH